MANLATMYCKKCGEEYDLKRCEQCRKLHCPCEITIECNHVPLGGREVVFHEGRLWRKKSKPTRLLGLVRRLWQR